MNRLKFLARVREAADAKGLKTERAISLAAGLSASFLRNIRIGNVRSPTSENLAKLAAVLDTTPDWLLGGDKASDDPHRAPAEQGDFEYIMVIGEVQAGTWREAFQWDEERRYGQPVPSDPRFPARKRFALRVVGHSMNEFYPDGATIFCVRYTDLGRGPRHGEHVVAQRFRKGLVEATVKEFVIEPGGQAMLVPRSTDAKFKPIRLPKTALAPPADDGPLPSVVNAGDLDAEISADTEEVVVLAMVTACYITRP